MCCKQILLGQIPIKHMCIGIRYYLLQPHCAWQTMPFQCGQTAHDEPRASLCRPGLHSHDLERTRDCCMCVVCASLASYRAWLHGRRARSPLTHAGFAMRCFSLAQPSAEARKHLACELIEHTTQCPPQPLAEQLTPESLRVRQSSELVAVCWIG